MKSKKDPVITFSVLKKVLSDSLTENNKSLIAIMDDRFSRQWMAVESKFNELREEMFDKFEGVDKKFEALENKMNSRFTKIDNKLDEIDEELIYIDSERVDLEDSIKNKKPHFVVN